MSSAANMAAAAYFKNGAYAAAPHMSSAALGFTASPAHNFLPGGMSYIGNSLADCQTAGITAWNASQAARSIKIATTYKQTFMIVITVENLVGLLLSNVDYYA
ncbi:hypothetical protein LOAG_12269 [Loa loa]|uniref:Uncharacterized protein n=1 Tax=Loa loa TaxID=7209 RepID=A0A1S0TLJ2_LOALO|nr:hypothetical protein LOAG_12269 [Loa loa]EFO16238.1 hypothetical protein LOAG_12269 [Loa loa]